MSDRTIELVEFARGEVSWLCGVPFWASVAVLSVCMVRFLNGLS